MILAKVFALKIEGIEIEKCRFQESTARYVKSGLH